MCGARAFFGFTTSGRFWAAFQVSVTLTLVLLAVASLMVRADSDVGLSASLKVTLSAE